MPLVSSVDQLQGINPSSTMTRHFDSPIRSSKRSWSSSARLVPVTPGRKITLCNCILSPSHPSHWLKISSRVIFELGLFLVTGFSYQGIILHILGRLSLRLNAFSFPIPYLLYSPSLFLHINQVFLLLTLHTCNPFCL